MKQRFTHTRAALLIYEAGEEEREALYAGTVDMPSFDAWEARCAEDVELVHLALYKDTRTYNSLDSCRMVHINTIREWCAKRKDVV